jgi:hypothetical protein
VNLAIASAAAVHPSTVVVPSAATAAKSNEAALQAELQPEQNESAE